MLSEQILAAVSWDKTARPISKDLDLTQTVATANAYLLLFHLCFVSEDSNVAAIRN